MRQVNDEVISYIIKQQGMFYRILIHEACNYLKKEKREIPIQSELIDQRLEENDINNMKDLKIYLKR
ncbi:MAG: hypothetical protein ACRC7V_05255 [Lachnospiraceae bacterium]